MYKKAMLVLMLFILFFLFLTFPAGAQVYNNRLSETVNAVFARLDGTAFLKSEDGGGNSEGCTEKHTELISEETTAGQNNDRPAPPEQTSKGGTTQNTDSVVVDPIPDFESDSIMRRMQEGGTIPLGEMTDKIDSMGTKFYNVITRSVIGLAPIVLIIGALFMLFTKGRVAGFLLLSMAALFAILNAPEIVAILINFIAGIFR